MLQSEEQCAENFVARSILDAAFKVHSYFGPGMYESIYERALATELTRLGMQVSCQESVPVFWEGQPLGEGFRADIIVNNLVLVELKSVEKLPKASFKQTLSYIRLRKLRLGLLINFGETFLKDGIHRVSNGL